MSFHDLLLKQGEWLFKKRSLLPLIFVPVIVIAMLYVANTGNVIQRNYAVKDYCCLAISLAGLMFRFFTVGYVQRGTAGRTTIGFEARSLKTKAVYSVVRHPLYLGNAVIYLGIFLYIGIWWLALLFITLLWLYYERIIFAEEEFLSRTFGNEYYLWAQKTPTFLPNFRLWSSSERHFSLRFALKREYSGLLAVVAVFCFLNIARYAIYFRAIHLDFMWRIFLVISVIMYVTLRTLKKNTNILNKTD